LFQNANSGWELPPQPPCAPVLTGGPVVDTIWLRLLERAGPRPKLALTDDADLHLSVDGHRVDAMQSFGSAHVFRLRVLSSELRIVSRAAAPVELGLARDPRVLGVALQRLMIRQSTRFRVIDPDDTRLSDGFHPFEAACGVRWTSGEAVLPAGLFDGFSGPLELVLHLGGATRYPADGWARRAA
jgi:hypothetical protein